MVFKNPIFSCSFSNSNVSIIIFTRFFFIINIHCLFANITNMRGKKGGGDVVRVSIEGNNNIKKGNIEN